MSIKYYIIVIIIIILNHIFFIRGNVRKEKFCSILSSVCPKTTKKLLTEEERKSKQSFLSGKVKMTVKSFDETIWIQAEIPWIFSTCCKTPIFQVKTAFRYFSSEVILVIFLLYIYTFKESHLNMVEL